MIRNPDVPLVEFVAALGRTRITKDEFREVSRIAAKPIGYIQAGSAGTSLLFGKDQSGKRNRATATEKRRVQHGFFLADLILSCLLCATFGFDPGSQCGSTGQGHRWVRNPESVFGFQEITASA